MSALDVKQYRFFAVFFRRTECSLCRSLLPRAQYAMKDHAEWHALRGESQVLGPGTVRAFCDVTVLPEGYATSTGWRTTGSGPR